LDRQSQTPDRRLPSHAHGAEPVVPVPVRETDGALWHFTQIAIIGTFLIAFCALLNFASTVLVPITSAIIFGGVLGPLEKRLLERRVPEWLFAVVVVLFMFIGLQISAILLSTSIIGWVRHAADFSNTLQAKLHIFEGGLNAIRDLQKALGSKDTGLSLNVAPLVQLTAAFLSPTLAELLIFFATLFFYLLGREGLRRDLVMVFANRESRLRTLRIISDVEENLARYFATVTIINAIVGTLTFIGCWIIGIPSPAVFGLLAFACNYIPYIGPAFVIVTLLAVGIVTLPTLGGSLWAPLLYLGMTTLEGNVITPKVVGTRLTLNPFAILVGLTFWTWLWGPIGAFLSVPFLIIGLAVRDRLAPENDPKLPE
jgi:predicted PurR-regulated permease PerM